MLRGLSGDVTLLLGSSGSEGRGTNDRTRREAAAWCGGGAVTVAVAAVGRGTIRRVEAATTEAAVGCAALLTAADRTLSGLSGEV